MKPSPVKYKARRCRYRIVTLVTMLAAPQATNAQESVADFVARIENAQPGASTALDSLSIRQLMERFRVPGMSIAVVRDFQVHWAKAYGVADAETNRPVTTATRFQAASISKPVAAMAAMRLAQDKRLDIDADINQVLKSWQIPASDFTRAQPVTPRSLLSHTSGADDGFGFPGYTPETPKPTLVQILNGQAPSNVGSVRFARVPFQGYKYSGGGVTIMQLAMIDLTGMQFAAFMQSTVLTPLGMTNSSFEQPPVPGVHPQLARAHNRVGAVSAAPWHVYPEQAAAGLWTTPTDLAQVIIELQTALRGPRGRVLDQASAREMVLPVGSGPFAVGFSIAQRGQGWYFSHGGSNWGFRANLTGHLRKGYGVVVMTNGDSGASLVDAVEDRIEAAYRWDTLDKPIPR